MQHYNNPLSAKLTKWPNTLKQLVSNLPTNYLSVFTHFVGLALKGIICCTMAYSIHVLSRPWLYTDLKHELHSDKDSLNKISILTTKHLLNIYTDNL